MAFSGRILAGRYRLEDSPPFRGGIGEVYRAYDSKMRRNVAIKIARADVLAENPGIANRFAESAIQLCPIEHPNLVRVFDYGESTAEHGPYIVMEWLEGPTYRAMLEAAKSGKRPPTRELLRPILQVCSAIAHVHRNEPPLVHRDLKPENVVLVGEQAKLIDFDLAKLDAGDRKQMTTVGTGGMGTPEYVAPEQWKSASAVGPQADVFSLGRILHEAISGVTPAINVPAEPLDLLDLPEDLGSDLNAVVMACLRSNPNARYADAQELLEQLEAALQGKPVRIPADVTPRRSAPTPSSDFASRVKNAGDSRRREPSAKVALEKRTPEPTAPDSSSGRKPPQTSADSKPRWSAPQAPKRRAMVAAGVGAVALLAVGSYAIVGGLKSHTDTPPRPTAGWPGAGTANPTVPSPPPIVHATFTIPASFAMNGLRVTVGAREVAVSDRDAASGQRLADRSVTVDVPAGEHTAVLQQGNTVVARLDRATFDATHAQLAFATPCPAGTVYVSEGPAKMAQGVGAPTSLIGAPFCIDVNEVSLGAFFGWCASSADSGAGVCSRVRADLRRALGPWASLTEQEHGSWPLSSVSPNDASTYCASRGGDGRLPTSAEWLRSAAPDNGSVWPWGASTVTPEEVAARGVFLRDGQDMYGDLQRLAIPNPRGASPYGVLGLVGGLEEWTCDTLPGGHCSHVAARGAGYNFPVSDVMRDGGLYTASVTSSPADTIGFRCVFPVAAPRAPEPPPAAQADAPPTAAAPAAVLTEIGYVSSEAPVRIRDFQTAEMHVTVPTSCPLARMSLSVEVSHAYVYSLRVMLRSPQGTEVVLQNQSESTPRNYAWDSRNGALHAFANQDARGTWTLLVKDNESGDGGTLSSFTIRPVCPAAP